MRVISTQSQVKCLYTLFTQGIKQTACTNTVRGRKENEAICRDDSQLSM